MTTFNFYIFRLTIFKGYNITQYFNRQIINFLFYTKPPGKLVKLSTIKLFSIILPSLIFLLIYKVIFL